MGLQRRRLMLGAASLAALIVLVACSTTAAHQATNSAVSTSNSLSSNDGHNGADVTFAQQMIPHHQQAIEMSDMLLPKEGVEPRVRDLASRIKTAQAPEIQQMQSWLQQWGVPTTSNMPSMGPGQGGMPGHTAMPGASPGMGGMMSDQDMAALREALGAPASKLFLTLMIEHHRGAISMATTEINSGQYPAGVSMARSIVSSQQQEIEEMQKLLSTV